MYRSLVALGLCGSLLSSPLALANPNGEKTEKKEKTNDLKNWGAYVHVGKTTDYGDSKSGQDAMLFVPIVQKKGDSILFLDLRGAISGDVADNVSVGMGYRKIVNDKFVVGANANIDRRQSVNDNTYHQASVGVEVLFNHLDLRANFYIPLDNDENTLAFSESATARLEGNKAFLDIVQKGTYERAHGGLDLGLSYNVGSIGNTDFNIDGSYYHFGSDNYESINGYTAGISTRTQFTTRGTDWEIGTTLGYRDDNVHGDSLYAGVGVTVYFGKSQRKRKSEPKLFEPRFNRPFSGKADLSQKLYQPVQRNAYVVTSTREEENNYSVQGTITVDDKTYDEIAATIHNCDDLVAAVNEAGENSMVVLDGSNGTFVLNEVLQVHENQSLVGGGTPVLVTGPEGQQAILILPGSNATVASIGNNGLQLTESSRLVNVTQLKITGPVDPELDQIVNGSFELGHGINGRGWDVFSSLPGWNADLAASDAPIEIQREIVIASSDGSAHLELDSHDFRGYSESNAHVYQDVDTEEGQAYRLAFDYSPRVNGNADTNTVEVFWEGKKIGEFSGDSKGWQTKELLVIAKSADLSRLEFRGSGTEDTYGALIDNVRLETVGGGN